MKCSECTSHGCLVTGLCLAMERQLSPGTVECGLIIYSGWPSPSCTLAVGLMLNPDFFFFSLPFSLLVVEVSTASPFRSREQDNTPIPLRRGKIGRSLQGSCSSKDNGILRVRKLLIRHPLLVSFPLRNSVHATHSLTALSQGLWPHNQTRVSVCLFVCKKIDSFGGIYSRPENYFTFFFFYQELWLAK